MIAVDDATVAGNVRAILSGGVSQCGATLRDCVDSFQYHDKRAFDSLVAFVTENVREALA